MFCAAGICAKAAPCSSQNRLDQLAQMRLVNVLVDPIEDRLHQTVRIVVAALDEIEEVKSIVGVFFRGRSNAQDVDLHAVTQVVLAANLEPVGHALGPGLCTPGRNGGRARASPRTALACRGIGT